MERIIKLLLIKRLAEKKKTSVQMCGLVLMASGSVFISNTHLADNVSVIDEIFPSNMVTEQKQGVTSWRAAFPDFQLTIDEISAGDNKVTVEWTFAGTHQGEFMGCYR